MSFLSRAKRRLCDYLKGFAVSGKCSKGGLAAREAPHITRLNALREAEPVLFSVFGIQREVGENHRPDDADVNAVVAALERAIPPESFLSRRTRTRSGPCRRPPWRRAPASN